MSFTTPSALVVFWSFVFWLFWPFLPAFGLPSQPGGACPVSYRLGLRLPSKITLKELIMGIKRMTEQELLKGLDARGAHADELAELLPQELTPLERLKGSVKRYERPTDPVWDEYFDSDDVESDDFMEDRKQPSPTQDKG